MKNMQFLPEGFYIVGEKFTQTIMFKNVEYKVEQGKNFFLSLADAVQSATVIPSTTLQNLNEYKNFDAPVILVSKGEYEIECVRFKKSIYLIGDGAKLNGSFWYGNLEMFDGCDKAVIDSFTFQNIRINDFRWNDGDFYLEAKNLKYVGFHPWRSFLCIPKKNVNHKVHYKLENVLVDGIDGYGYGCEFFSITVASLSITNFIYKNTEKLLGLSSFDKKNSTVLKGAVGNFVIKNAEFAFNRWQKGITFNADGDANIRFENCVFTDNLLDEVDALFDLSLTKDSILAFENCTFHNGKGKKLLLGKIDASQVDISKCSVENFVKNKDGSFIFDEESLIDSYVESISNSIEDKHAEVVDADFSALENYYLNRKPFYCDMHVHSKSGGTSDGWVDIADWPKEMAEQKVDFVAIADHRQMRHFFLPEFDDTKFFYANEPEALLKEKNVKFDKLHYNMIFPDKYGLKKVLEKFSDKYEFSGDELTGSFIYKDFTHAELSAVAEYISKIGGMFVHAHPMAMLVSDDIENFCFGDKSYIEIFSDDYSGALSVNNWKLWTKLINLGKKVYNISGSDSHAHCKNSCVNVVYAEEKINSSLYPYFKKGDFSSGGMGVKMMLGKTAMGGTATFNENDNLLIVIDDLFEVYKDKNKRFLVNVITDKGIAYSCRYDAKEKLKIALKSKERKFYRVEVIDLDYRTPFGVSNPIWVD